VYILAVSAAGCIIYNNSLVLLARRIEGPEIAYSGYWSIFAGSREPPAESPRVCASRELDEETGIKISPIDLVFCKTIYKGSNTFDIFKYNFDEIPNVNLNEEHTEYGWFKVEELDRFPYLIDSKIVKIIKSNC
jgi:8-oxo-dGTP pyrophosphatase MutT (NUDIX family)